MSMNRNSHLNLGRPRAALLGVAVAAALGGLLAATGSAAPRVATDGGIVFSRAGEIVVRGPSGASRRLTQNRVHDGLPAWSPDRRRIAFVRDTGRDGDIHVMRADGTDVRRLTGGSRPGRSAQDLYPAWSPDGRLIAFSSSRGDREAEIYVMRADGTGVRRLTRTARHVQNIQPRFSPDGRFVVFASNRIAYWNIELFRVRVADGGGITRLTYWGSGQDGAPGDDVMPSYSPDGTRIAFVSDRNGGYAVWTMAANGRGIREVARHRGQNVAFPRFSPDGRSLVYTTFSPDSDQSDLQLWTVRADGTGRKALGAGTEPDW
jgi:TolB protein